MKERRFNMRGCIRAKELAEGCTRLRILIEVATRHSSKDVLVAPEEIRQVPSNFRGGWRSIRNRRIYSGAKIDGAAFWLTMIYL